MAAERTDVTHVSSATRGEMKSSDLVSIVVPCCGQLEYARLCVPRLLKYTARPCKLIFVSFASLDGTDDYLDGVAAAAPVPVEIIQGTADPSLRVAYKQAFSEAGGEFVVLLS